MDTVWGRLTVFFEDPFWISILERISEGKLSVCKVTFLSGTERLRDIQFCPENYYRL